MVRAVYFTFYTDHEIRDIMRVQMVRRDDQAFTSVYMFYRPWNKRHNENSIGKKRIFGTIDPIHVHHGTILPSRLLKWNVVFDNKFT